VDVERFLFKYQLDYHQTNSTNTATSDLPLHFRILCEVVP